MGWLRGRFVENLLRCQRALPTCTYNFHNIVGCSHHNQRFDPTRPDRIFSFFSVLSEFSPRKPVRYLLIDLGRVRLRFLRTIFFCYIPNPLRPGTVQSRLYLAIAHLNSVAEGRYQRSLNKRKPRIEDQEQHAK